jgi:hypothetical protein
MDWDIDTDGVHRGADGVGAVGAALTEAWGVHIDTINDSAAAIGPPERMASAFYSGYNRKRERLTEAATTLPARYAERARAGHESAEMYFLAELRATGGFLG